MRRRRNGDNRPLLVVLEAFKGFVQKLYDARKALDASQATATAKEQAERVRAAMQKLVLTLGNSDVMRREIDDDSLSAKDVLKSHMQRAKSRNAMQKGGFFSRLFGGNKRDSTSGGSSKNLAQKIDRAAQRESQAQRAERMKHVSELCALIELPLLTPPSSGILPEGPRNDDKIDKLAMSLRSLVANPRVMLALHRSCTSTNPGAEPENVEAKRQLVFFCNSLHNRRLRRPPTLPHMKSWSAFTPHYAEDVTYRSRRCTRRRPRTQTCSPSSDRSTPTMGQPRRALPPRQPRPPRLGVAPARRRPTIVGSAMNIVIPADMLARRSSLRSDGLPSVAARASPRSDCDEGSSPMGGSSEGLGAIAEINAERPSVDGSIVAAPAAALALNPEAVKPGREATSRAPRQRAAWDRALPDPSEQEHHTIAGISPPPSPPSQGLLRPSTRRRRSRRAHRRSRALPLPGLAANVVGLPGAGAAAGGGGRSGSPLAPRSGPLASSALGGQLVASQERSVERSGALSGLKEGSMSGRMTPGSPAPFLEHSASRLGQSAEIRQQTGGHERRGRSRAPERRGSVSSRSNGGRPTARRCSLGRCAA